MGKIIYNGRGYSGLIKTDGVFIDTRNLIYETQYTGTFSYTATQDCFVKVPYAASSSSVSVNIMVDGIAVRGGWGLDYTLDTIPLKKGQTISLQNGDSVQRTLRVYGIQMGSTVQDASYLTVINGEVNIIYDDGT